LHALPGPVLRHPLGIVDMAILEGHFKALAGEFLDLRRRSAVALTAEIAYMPQPTPLFLRLPFGASTDMA